MYVHTHRHTPLAHRCDLCGAVHNILNLVATLTVPGLVPKKTTQFELDIAAGTLAPHDEPQLTGWISDLPPQREGFFHIKFPNDTEADRNWWWNNDTGRFEYYKGSPVTLAFVSIGAWRGLDKPYF
jgi:hypothetical protein